MAKNPRALAKALLANTPTNAPTGNGGFGGLPGTLPGTSLSPMVASYDAWTTGQAYTGRGLPREVAAFLSGSFGPGAPIRPIGVDTPDPQTGLPDPRRNQMPISWNLPMGPPGGEGLGKLATFPQLRAIGDTYSVARACINVRKSELVGLEWDILPTKAAEKKMRGNESDRREWDERRAKAMRFFRRPDPNYFSFSSWFNAQLEDILVIDAWSLFLQPARRKGKGPLGSDLGALRHIDGATVRPMVDITGGTPAPPNVAYQQYLFGVPRSDMTTVYAGTDVADMSDALYGEYRGDQLLYLPYELRVWSPYGFAPVEKALVPIMSGLNRQQWQLEYFSEGTVPGLFVSAGDPNMTPGQIRELQDALNAMAGDPAWKHKIIVLPGGSKTDPMRPTELAGVFDETVMTQVAMAFDVMPMELGVSPRMSTSGHSAGAANQMGKMSSDAMKRKANKPLLMRVMEVFDFVLQEVLRQDDMRFVFEGLEENEDEATLVTNMVKEISAGLMSIDEGRMIRNRQPWNLPITSDPVLMLPTGLIPIKGLDPETGQLPAPPPAPIAGNPGDAGDPGTPSGPPPDGGQPALPPGPSSKPKPAGGGKKPSSAPTPAHAGAETADAVNGQQSGQPATKSVNTFAALDELDKIRRRLVKGRSLDGWVSEHIPADLFGTLTDLASVDAARAVVKGLDPRQRRDQSIADTEQRVSDGLRRLVAGLTHGTVSTATFVDQGVDVMRTAIRQALATGAAHARVDAVTKAARVPDVPPGTDARTDLYAGAVNRAYEQGYGLHTLGHDPTATIVWHARPGACDLCDERDGKRFNLDTLPGMPGDGDFGADATICRGSVNCRCRLEFQPAPFDPNFDPDTDDYPPVPPGVPSGPYVIPVNVTLKPAEPAPPEKQQLDRDVAAASAALHGPDPEKAFEDVLDQVADRVAEAQRPYLTGFMQDILAARSGLATPEAVENRWSRRRKDDDGGWLVPAAVIAVALYLALHDQAQQQAQAAPATVGAPVQS